MVYLWFMATFQWPLNHAIKRRCAGHCDLRLRLPGHFEPEVSWHRGCCAQAILPYVADAQVYWNLNQSLVVNVVSKQAKAKVFMNDETFLLTEAHELLPAPRQTPLDLPIITGLKDSANAARAGLLLDEVIASPAFTFDGQTAPRTEGPEDDWIDLPPQNVRRVKSRKLPKYKSCESIHGAPAMSDCEAQQ